MKIALFGNTFPDRTLEAENRFCNVCKELAKYSAQMYVPTAFFNNLSSDAQDLVRSLCELFDSLPPVDMAFSIGGDGTFLRTASAVGCSGIPVLGINIGRLGFLSDMAYDDMADLLGNIVRGDYRIEERTMLEFSTNTNETPFGNDTKALNEVAVMKQETASMIAIHTYINDEYLITYMADGLVVATATGSTAYALSLGGPILMPTSSNIILAAIAPHSLTLRPMIVDDSCTIRLEIESRSHNFLVSMDGQSQMFDENVQIEIRKAPYKLRVVKHKNQTFYRTLRDKLMWGVDVRS